MEKRKNIALETLTGEQFKTLIEQFTHDGKVDTIPELMERVGQIPDDMTIEDYIKTVAYDAPVAPEMVEDAVDEVIRKNASEAYEQDNRRLYLFGRPKEED